MKFEDQFCSLELSNKLKELGVKQDSFFYWIKSSNPNAAWNLSMNGGFNRYYHPEHVSAFTVAELGEILPWELRYERKNFVLVCVKIMPNLWSCCYEESRDTNLTLSFGDEYEADARAKMIIHLLENKLMELPK